jgi:HK97 family phage prohead protease
MAGAPVEVRKSTDAGWQGGGLALVYGSRSENLGGFIEEIRAGALTDVLARTPDVRALINHSPDAVLGRTTSGTLRIADTPEGLDYEFDAPDTTYARNLRVLMERGDITQSSFAFRAAPDGVEWDEDPETGVLVRVIHRFSALLDVSPVTYPAYPAATSGIRSSAPVVESAAPDGREGSDDDEQARKARARAFARRRRMDLRQRRPR